MLFNNKKKTKKKLESFQQIKNDEVKIPFKIDGYLNLAYILAHC